MADPRDEPVEEGGRIDVNADERVGFPPPAARPVGDRHAARQRAGQLDVDGRRPRRHQFWIQRHTRGQRVVQVRQDGRQRLYRLNGQALKPIYEWVSAYERSWSERFEQMDTVLDDLKEKEKDDERSG